MVFWPPYPWYIDPATHDILTPLTMVYRPPLPMEYRPPYLWYTKPSHGIMNSSLLVKMRGVNLPWGGSKDNDKQMTSGSNYHMENWTRGQNIIWKLTPGSIYHGVQNTIWHRSISSRLFSHSKSSRRVLRTDGDLDCPWAYPPLYPLGIGLSTKADSSSPYSSSDLSGDCNLCHHSPSCLSW